MYAGILTRHKLLFVQLNTFHAIYLYKYIKRLSKNTITEKLYVCVSIYILNSYVGKLLHIIEYHYIIVFKSI